MALLRSLRALLFGETWTIPSGVGLALLVGFGLRSVLSDGAWQRGGGFVLAALVAATLVVSVWASR
jgi:hypothetical protein